MEHASTLIGSDDVTLDPAQQLDAGHVAIITAGCGLQEFWLPVLDWIEDHPN